MGIVFFVYYAELRVDLKYPSPSALRYKKRLSKIFLSSLIPFLCKKRFFRSCIWKIGVLPVILFGKSRIIS
jgi:hypothetical protein